MGFLGCPIGDSWRGGFGGAGPADADGRAGLGGGAGGGPREGRSRRGDKGRDDRRFLEALHYFAVHNVTWRALPAEFGNWNSVWKRFWRLSVAGQRRLAPVPPPRRGRRRR